MTLRRVLFPLLRPGLVAGWIWVMAHAFRELNTAILLSNQQTRPVGVAMYALWNDGAFGTFEFSVPDCTIALQHNERYTDVNTITHEF